MMEVAEQLGLRAEQFVRYRTADGTLLCVAETSLLRRLMETPGEMVDDATLLAVMNRRSGTKPAHDQLKAYVSNVRVALRNVAVIPRVFDDGFDRKGYLILPKPQESGQ